MSLLTIEEPAGAPARVWSSSHALWRLGFRPFYLLAALFAALSVPLWLANYFGVLGTHLQVDLNWHMHEMVFGMAIAVIVGFLFTAVPNWTGLPTPRKGHLAALAALWLAGRLAMLCGPAPLAAAIDVLFLPLAAWPIYRVLRQSGNTRNLFLVALLGLLTVANVCFHAAVLGVVALAPGLPVQAAILIIVIIESVIGARVIPMFTRNGAPGSEPVVHGGRDRVALGVMAATALACLFGAPAPVLAVLAVITAGATLLRLAGWKTHRTLRLPLLWVLHISYGWIAIGFLLLAMAAYGIVTVSAAFHALTVGSMAGLILGMMTRTALGHTGRRLQAGAGESAIYWLIQLAALARVGAAVGPVVLRNALLVGATVCWSAAFLTYLYVYAPYLWRARVDGKEG